MKTVINNKQKIFGIGLSKTGTTSLFAALNMLGYRSGTYRHLQRRGLSKWFQGDFSYDYISDFDAVTDLPIGSFYTALDDRYPGSKFILTTRNKVDWLNSCRRYFSTEERKRVAANSFYNQTQLSMYGVSFFNEAQFSYIYDCHEYGVRKYFRDRDRDRDLLTISITEGQGWDKLCPFLGEPIPSCDFPIVLPGGGKRPDDLKSKKQAYSISAKLNTITNHLTNSTDK